EPLQRNAFVLAGDRLGDQRDRVGGDFDLVEVDGGDFDVHGEEGGQLAAADRIGLEEQSAEGAGGASGGFQGLHDFLVGEDAFFDKKLAQAFNVVFVGHGCLPGAGRARES